MISEMEKGKKSRAGYESGSRRWSWREDAALLHRVANLTEYGMFE